MAGISFWAAEDDQARIVQSILALGQYGLSPDLHYPDPIPSIYREQHPDLFEAMAKKKRLYIAGPFSKEPISMSPIKGGKSDGGYFIYEATGGPLLILSLPGCKMVKDTFELTPGNFFYRPEYWDKDITHASKPSDELKEHYKLIQKDLKRFLVHKGSRWIGQSAWKLLENGSAIILDKGKWWNGKGNFIRSNLSQTSA